MYISGLKWTINVIKPISTLLTKILLVLCLFQSQYEEIRNTSGLVLMFSHNQYSLLFSATPEQNFSPRHKDLNMVVMQNLWPAFYGASRGIWYYSKRLYDGKKLNDLTQEH